MESGLRLTERYRLVERLDDGGTDTIHPGKCSLEVWRAWDELLGRPVAVKLLAPAHAGLHRAFHKGVNDAAGLSHAALETVYDSDRTRDEAGRLVSYVVTEFLNGETLAERLRLGPLTASETIEICAQVAGALETAHASGVAHGDLEPGKILLCGEVKIVDTGIGGIVRPPSAHRQAPAEAAAADVRALGAVIAACLPAEAPPDLLSLAARCSTATAAEGPSAARIAALLARDDEPPNAVFTTVRNRAPSHDHRTRVLHPLPRRRPRGRRARLAALALVVAIPVTAAAAVLTSTPRAPVSVPSPSATRADAPENEPETEAGVTDALGRLRPIVSRGYTTGQIRSDVAIDLNNVITNLENDLTSDRDVDVEERIDLLQGKIFIRERERALSPGLADELNRVLATIQT